MAKDRKITTFDFGDILHYQKNNCFIGRNEQSNE